MNLDTYIGRTVGVVGQPGEFVITSIGNSVGLRRSGSMSSRLSVDGSDITGIALPKKKFGCANKNHGKNLPPLSPAEILERLEHLADSASVVKTGRHYGVSDKTVSRWRNKHAPNGLKKAIEALRAEVSQ